MKREERKVLDLRKGYTIDEVEELRNGRLIKMSSIDYPSYKGRRKAKTRRTTTMALVFATAAAVLAALSLASSAARAEEPSIVKEPEPLIKEMVEPMQTVGEDSMEAEKIEAALIEQGYFREDVPLSYELQDVLRTASEANGIPYHVALGLIETESGFDPDAVSSAGCYGLAQLNPTYFPSGLSTVDNLTTGMDYLGYQLECYNGDLEAALTAYNAGHDTGARGYARAVLEAAENWR
ncbi:MAG: lytic transglycosylase domain-containing protein [Flavonifractor plautii]|nr:MAG TPA: GEWL-like protein [Caudoviricetes sp.]